MPVLVGVASLRHMPMPCPMVAHHRDRRWQAFVGAVGSPQLQSNADIAACCLQILALTTLKQVMEEKVGILVAQAALLLKLQCAGRLQLQADQLMCRSRLPMWTLPP